MGFPNILRFLDVRKSKPTGRLIQQIDSYRQQITVPLLCQRSNLLTLDYKLSNNFGAVLFFCRVTCAFFFFSFFFFSSSGGWGRKKKNLRLTTLPRIFKYGVCRLNSSAFAIQRY